MASTTLLSPKIGSSLSFKNRPLGDFVMGDQVLGRQQSVTHSPMVQGAIRNKWAQLGGTKSFLGLPSTYELTTPDKIGRYNHFRGGSIYWTPETGAHEVHGKIRGKWAGLGWEKSFLGYPTTDERTTPDKIGRYNHFQGGSVYWTPDTGAHEVHGAIRGKWAGLGWEKSFLGYPTTDERTTSDKIGRYNHFQGGSVYWTPDTGAHEVHGAIRDKWARLGWERSVLGYPVSDELTTPNGKGKYSVFEEGVIKWDPITGAGLARSIDVSSQAIIKKIDTYILEGNPKLYMTGDTEVVKVHDWYNHDGKSHRKVLEVDLDLKYSRKGTNPGVDLDLFFSFGVEDGEIKATLVNAEHDVSFPWWHKVVSLGIGQIMETVGNNRLGDNIGDYIGQSIASPAGGALAAQVQDDGSLKIFS